MKRKNDIRFMIIFIVVLGISLLYLSQASLAKYRKQLTGDIETTIASWNIKVNNEDIKNKSTLTKDITPVFDNNNYVKDGVIAPGSKGHFDLVINAEEVDVDFNYEIIGVVNNETPLLDLKLTEYDVNGTKNTYSPDTNISGTIQKNTGNTSIRVYFEWVDDDSNQMNNKQDTVYATTDEYKDTSIKLTIRFTQKK